LRLIQFLATDKVRALRMTMPKKNFWSGSATYRPQDHRIVVMSHGGQEGPN
jgi:hypothetical protein